MRTLLLALPIALAACTDVAPGPSFEGGLSGTISGSSIGPLVGVTVIVTPNGSATSDTAVTRNAGAYSLSVVTGNGTITLSGLPTTCQTPAPASYSVSQNTTSIVNIQVSCTSGPTTGTVTGSITTSLGSGIANAQVTVTPSGGPALAAVTTDMNGNYTVSSVAAGGGSVAVSNLPSNCPASSAQPYGVFRHSDPYVSRTQTITPTPGSAPMRFGSKDFSNYFKGAIGPVRVWDRALSASEIAALYSSNTVPSVVVASYGLTEEQGTTIIDGVAGNNGALYNTTWGQGARTPVASATGTSGGGC